MMGHSILVFIFMVEPFVDSNVLRIRIGNKVLLECKQLMEDIWVIIESCYLEQCSIGFISYFWNVLRWQSWHDTLKYFELIRTDCFQYRLWVANFSNQCLRWVICVKVIISDMGGVWAVGIKIFNIIKVTTLILKQ